MSAMPDRHLIEIQNGQSDKQDRVSEEWSKLKISI